MHQNIGLGPNAPVNQEPNKVLKPFLNQTLIITLYRPCNWQEPGVSTFDVTSDLSIPIQSPTGQPRGGSLSSQVSEHPYRSCSVTRLTWNHAIIRLTAWKDVCLDRWGIIIFV